jgi:hypothetical protein
MLAEHEELETVDVHPPPTRMAFAWATLRVQAAESPAGVTDENIRRLWAVSAHEEPPPLLLEELEEGPPPLLLEELEEGPPPPAQAATTAARASSRGR